MKNLLFLFSFLLVVFTSCKPKYEKLIDDYMKENLHDYSSYEPISFDFEAIYDRKNKLFIKRNSLIKIAQNMGEQLSGWYITHSYRATNGYGALRLGKLRFIFNKDKDIIIFTPNQIELLEKYNIK